jgi:hypothetical protein
MMFEHIREYDQVCYADPDTGEWVKRKPTPAERRAYRRAFMDERRRMLEMYDWRKREERNKRATYTDPGNGCGWLPEEEISEFVDKFTEELDEYDL